LERFAWCRESPCRCKDSGPGSKETSPAGRIPEARAKEGRGQEGHPKEAARREEGGGDQEGRPEEAGGRHEASRGKEEYPKETGSREKAGIGPDSSKEAEATDGVEEVNPKKKERPVQAQEAIVRTQTIAQDHAELAARLLPAAMSDRLMVGLRSR
jgi:hypothetical protein